jgi:hypothetical protein
MLHPAHTLKQEQIAVGSGISSRVVMASAKRRIDAAHDMAANNAIDGEEGEQTFVEGSLLGRSLAPGLAPWVGGRVGLGQDWEAGMSYTGHRLRVDGRHAFGDDLFALSVGSAVNLLTLQLEPGSEGSSMGGGTNQRLASEGLEFSATGWGVELPVMIGTRSFSRLFEPALGVRLGYERVFGQMPLTVLPPSTPPGGGGATSVTHARAAAQRFSAEGVLGLSAGSGIFYVRLEVAAGIHQASGSLDFPAGSGDPQRRRLALRAFSLQPAAALVLELE